jgi:LacI family transcriptional regulator
MQECGIEEKPEWMIEGDHTMEGGMSAAKRLLSSPALPTAIMCSNDMSAIGVLHTLHRNHCRVPEDVSLIGFDNIHMSEVMIPPLTSVQMSRVDLARAAVSALRAHVEGTSHQREYRIITNLVVRESTAFPRADQPSPEPDRRKGSRERRDQAATNGSAVRE